METDRFLLIKAWSYILWSDVDHVLGLLLVAELTGRIPVIYWPTHYLNNGFVQTNGFELYFEPINSYTIHNLSKPEYTYYPPIWNYDNLMVDDNARDTLVYRNIGDILCSKANVVVADIFYNIYELIPFIGKNHTGYGMAPEQIYRYLLGKYIKIKPDIEMEIQGYYNSWIKGNHPVLAVHVRRANKEDTDENGKDSEDNKISKGSKSSKVKKSSRREKKESKFRRRLSGKDKYEEQNRLYHGEIHKYIKKYSIRKIFLLTDCQSTLREYGELYGPMLIHTDCKRLQSGEDISLMENPMISRRRGIEIIKDTYIASRCDFFIGNEFSSLSRAVVRLKEWPDKSVKLLYRLYKKQKYPVNADLPDKDKDGIFSRLVNMVKRLMGRGR